MITSYFRSDAYFIGLPFSNEVNDIEELTSTLRDHPFGFVCHFVLGNSATHTNVKSILKGIKQLPYDARVLIYITGELIQDEHNQSHIKLLNTKNTNLELTAISLPAIFQLPYQVQAKHIAFIMNVPIELEQLEPFVTVGAPQDSNQTAYQMIMRDKNSEVSLAKSLHEQLKAIQNQRPITLTNLTYNMKGIFPTFNLYVKGSGMGDLIFATDD